MALCGARVRFLLAVFVDCSQDHGFPRARREATARFGARWGMMRPTSHGILLAAVRTPAWKGQRRSSCEMTVAWTKVVVVGIILTGCSLDVFFLQAEPTRFADELGEEYKSMREVKHDYRYLDEPLEGWRSHNQEGRIPGKPGGQFWAHQG